jgi:hypothetical protein
VNYNFFVITDNNDSPLPYLTITTALRDEMTSTLQKRIIHNLEETKELLKSEVYERACAGLLTYAIEEYGKILFLKSFSVSADDKITFPYRSYKSNGKYYGFLAHDEKFLRVLNDPNFSKLLYDEDFANEVFVKGDFVTELVADLKARLALFFADFEKNNSTISIMKPPLADRPLLQEEVDGFLIFIKNQNFT